MSSSEFTNGRVSVVRESITFVAVAVKATTWPYVVVMMIASLIFGGNPWSVVCQDTRLNRFVAVMNRQTVVSGFDIVFVNWAYSH